MRDMPGVRSLPEVARALAEAGYAPEQVRDVMGGNALRFLRRVLP